MHKKKVITFTISPLCLENIQVESDAKKMSDLLNEYFALVFTVEDTSDLLAKNIKLGNSAPFKPCNISEDVIIKALDKLNANKTPGPDGIASCVLKDAKEQIFKPLSIIFNKSLICGKVPLDWNSANITPIQKKKVTKTY